MDIREFGRKLRGPMLAALFVLPTGALHAQGLDISNLAVDAPKDPVAEAKREEIDRAYQASTKKIPAAQQPSDPWGSVRTAPASLAPQKKAAGTK